DRPAVGRLRPIEAEAARRKRERNTEALAYPNRGLHLRVLRARVAGDVHLRDDDLLQRLFEIRRLPDDLRRQALVARFVAEVQIADDHPPRALAVRAIADVEPGEAAERADTD